jgi:hypothetical protein
MKKAIIVPSRSVSDYGLFLEKGLGECKGRYG